MDVAASKEHAPYFPSTFASIQRLIIGHLCFQLIRRNEIETRKWLYSVGLALTLASNAALAAMENQQTTVLRMLVDDTEFGHCMVLIRDMPATLDCPGNWVTASCSGDFNSSSVGWRKMEVAQMAQALNKQIFIRIDDARRHNQHCFLKRIQLLN